MTPVLEAVGISHTWIRVARDIRVLDGVNLSLPAAKIAALYGSPGSGRSTLFRILGGFEPPGEGALLLDGQPVQGDDVPTRAAAIARRVGSPGSTPHPRWGALTFVASGLALQGVHREEREEKARLALERVDFARVQNALPDEFDAWGRIRLTWARCLAEGVALLLVDQAPIDRSLDAMRWELLVRLRDETGLGALFIPRFADVGREADARYEMASGHLKRL